MDAEAKQLHTSATHFAKQTQQWMNLIESFSSALKVLQLLLFNCISWHSQCLNQLIIFYQSQEIGDVENWARSIENDMTSINETLNLAYKKSKDGTT